MGNKYWKEKAVNDLWLCFLELSNYIHEKLPVKIDEDIKNYLILCAKCKIRYHQSLIEAGKNRHLWDN